ncbi:MAG: SDR family NAD(P)-dependent oxidoreductase [Dehalococcoidia bacterium]
MSLTDQVAIVTGASRGIGRAIAMALAAQGADIVVAARTEPVPGTIEETAAMVEDLGRRALPVEMNVVSEEDVERTVRATLERFGRIDILVNNAGTNWARTVKEFEPSRWELVLRVNAFGPFLCSKNVIPHMIEQGHGHILNISSVAAVRVSPGSTAYSASKAALEALTIGLSNELFPHGVCSNAIRLEGTVETPGTTMLLKTGTPRETMWPVEIMGEAAAYICQQPFPYTGQVRTIAQLRRYVPRINELLTDLGKTADD